MTKLEICKKLHSVLWNALLSADGGRDNNYMSIAKVIQEILIDLESGEEDPVVEEKEPEAVVEPKGETCPKCGSDEVIITDVEIRRCSKCGYEFVPCPCGKTIRPANSALQYCEYCHTYFGTNDPEKDPVPWEKPQTNFDKWKKELTAEKLGRIWKDWDVGCYCEHCPANKVCSEEVHKHDNCGEIFLAWANEPAKED